MSKVETVIDFYSKVARPFLVKHKEDLVQAYDGQLRSLQKVMNLRQEPIHACFLGISGIGKSTLLNALIAENITVLPAGGIGPLTAQAIQVKYGAKASFRAEYHGMDKVNQLRFALEQFYRVEKHEGRKPAEVLPEDSPGLDEEYKAHISEIISSASDGHIRERKENLIKQVALIIAGKTTADKDLADLIDGLRTLQGVPLAFGSVFSEEELDRIKELKACIRRGTRQYMEGKDDNFDAKLRNHAAGYFSPLIKTLEVTWKSSLLDTGLTLVDLPGVGIAGDPYKETTATFLRERAKAVILVVPKSGETEADASALRDSGFLNRLLYSADNPAEDPVNLIIAVTRVDDVAEQRYRDDVSKVKKKWEHLADVIAETEANVRIQTLGQLREEWDIDRGDTSDQKNLVLKTIQNTLQVVPLSAPEYRRFIGNDDDDRPFIKELSQSNVPRLKELLSGLASRISAERQRRLDEHNLQFASSLKSEIDVLEAKWQDNNRSLEEQEMLSRDLAAFLGPLRDEYKNREGAFRNYLKETIPIHIEGLVNEACNVSRNGIRAYLGTLEDAHWNTLRASVRRGGTFVGSRNIDLPNDFALKFEEPIAAVWEKRLLKEIRLKTAQFGEDCVALVERVVEWSRGQGTRIATKALEAHQESIKADAKGLDMIGKEAIEELRKSIIVKMISETKGPIRAKCDVFVKSGDAAGPGVKSRILRLFDTLSEDAVKSAREPAAELIKSQFRYVEREILASFKKLENPVDAIRDTILGTHKTAVERRDRRIARIILEEIDTIRSQMPDDFTQINAC